MVPFGGWDMPVEYSGITDEHMAVRTRAGLFDVSHMGEIEIAGADALAAVQKISSNDASRLAIGQIHYSALTTPAGTFVDDLLVYRMADDHFLLVVNASNIEKDYAWIRSQVAELRRCPGREHEQPVRAAGAAGTSRARGAADAHVGAAGGDEVLLVRHRRSRRRARHDLAHRLHRRGRLRGVRAAGAGRARLAGDAAGRRGRRRHPGRPGRARHAAPGSVDAPVRQRHGRDHDRPRGGTRLDRRLEEGRRSMAPTCCAPRRPAASIGRSSASRWSTAPSPATAIRS